MRENDFPGTLIVIDGPDGAGTTTQAERLTEHLDANYTAEHGDRRETESLIGRKVEEMISKERYKPQTVALGFAADRMVHLEQRVIPWLKEGKTVVCDRYYHASLAYQPVMGAEREWVKNINKNALKPDLTVLLDVEANIAMDRLEDRGKDGNIFEKLDFQQHVILKYREMAEKLDENILLIDGSESKKEVFEEVKSAVEQNLP